jgi:hypothetical protein
MVLFWYNSGIMRTGELIILLLISLFCSAITLTASAVPPPAVATCKITCTVAEIVEWSKTSFPDIDIGELTVKNKQASGEAELTLYTNGDITIIADNSNSAELSFGSHTLQTEYNLKFDGSGTGQTGGKSTSWSSFDTFLKGGADIVHSHGDGAVVVTLSVKASIAEEINSENSGQYNATQTLTACWKS